MVDQAFGLVLVILIEAIDRNRDAGFLQGFQTGVDLGDAAIDEDQIRIGEILILEPLIAAIGDLLHRVVIVPGVLLVEMELALHPFGGLAIDIADHRADRRGALKVRVIEKLDPIRGFNPQELAKLFQKGGIVVFEAGAHEMSIEALPRIEGGQVDLLQ